MTEEFYGLFIEKVPELEGRGFFKERREQLIFCDLMKNLIIDTCKKPFNEKTISAFIQIANHSSLDENISKYIGYLKLENEEFYREKILEKPKGLRGITGAGKSSIKVHQVEGLENFEEVRKFLISVNLASTREEVKQAVEEFDALKINHVTDGVYSPWLTYLKPEFCPIANNSMKGFYKTIGWDGISYSSLMDFTLELLDYFPEKNYFLLDSATRRVSLEYIYEEKIDLVFPYPKIAKMFQASLHYLFNQKLMTEEHVRNLEDAIYCNDTFNSLKKKRSTKFPLLLKVDKSIDHVEQRKFDTKQARFYHPKNVLYHFNGDEYFLCTETIKEQIVDLESWLDKNFSLSFEDIANSENEAPGGEIMDPKVKHDLNMIFFGPPGTGKTYEVRREALKIIMGDDAPTDYKEVIKKFNEFRESKQVDFVTFHPNFGYENFVEGIFPDVESSDKLTYQKKTGVFKNISEEALRNYNSTNAGEFNIDEEFDKRYKLFTDEIEESLEYIEFKSLDEGVPFTVSVTKTNAIYTERRNGNGHHIAEKRFRKIFKDLFIKNKRNPVIADILASSLKTYITPIMRKLFSYNVSSTAQSSKVKNYVLVIDEINRGNIPAIFGELITLIEPSKRIGNNEALKLTLPLSDEDEDDFGVPKNLYIIGTMNTADRSVEALDIALRRRFSFKAKYPNENHKLLKSVGDINIKTMLKKINERIRVLKGADYQIGHSYFMNLETEECIRNAFEKKVLPLLNEYFYEDLEKIQMILGKSFVETVPVRKEIFAANSPDFDEFDSYTIKDRSSWKFKKIYE